MINKKKINRIARVKQSNYNRFKIEQSIIKLIIIDVNIFAILYKN